jgi:hypothetical protein
MKRFITNQPGKQTVRKIGMGGLYKPYGKGSTVPGGDVLGPELVVNGGFDTDTDWTEGTGWSISGGTANGAAGTSSQLTQQAPGLILDGVTYRMTYTVVAVDAASVDGRLGGTIGPQRTAPVTYTQDLVAGATGIISIRKTATPNCIIDNVSVKEVL